MERPVAVDFSIIHHLRRCVNHRGFGMTYKIITSDVMDWLNLASRYNYRRNYYHAFLSDAPYHLTSITERSGKSNMQNKDTPNRLPYFKGLTAGFMGQSWDGGDLAFNPELWAGFREMLMPGAFGFAFAGSRGWHRMACAIEDAGFVFHPTTFLLGWSYGSGFPKATRIDTQIDKAAGVEVEKGKAHPAFAPRNVGYREEEFTNNDHVDGQKHSPQTELAQQWTGHRYGLQAQKPALEPILCFQKPYEDRPVDSITASGAGALNIDAGRIAGEFVKTTHGSHPQNIYGDLDYINGQEFESHPKGRWPANLILEHTPECRRVGVRRVQVRSPGDGTRHNTPDGVNKKHSYGRSKEDWVTTDHADSDGLETVDDWQCVEGCPVRRLGEQGGESAARQSMRGVGLTSSNVYGDGQPDFDTLRGHSDSGTAARYFYQSHWAYEILERIAESDPTVYMAKASKKERNAGLDSLPDQIRHRVNPGGLENEPRWAPIEAKNPHPTIKPIALTKYLAGLLLPPDAYAPRRILIPFFGSGSEGIGAALAGWDDITGIEMTKEYIPVAHARMRFWLEWLEWGQTDIDTILATVGDDRQAEIEAGQMSLF